MAIKQLPLMKNAAEKDGYIQSSQMAPGIKGKKITWINKNGMLGFVESIIFSQKEAKQPFFILDLGPLINLVHKWAHDLPMIQPYYVVKCIPNSQFLGAMAALGLASTAPAELRSNLSCLLVWRRIELSLPTHARCSLTSSMLLVLALTWWLSTL